MDEKRIIKANGFKLIHLDSQLVPLYADAIHRNDVQSGELTSIISCHFLTPSYVVAYLYSMVKIGKWEDNSFQFYESECLEKDHILKLRVFNSEQELLVWKSGSSLKARLRKDNLNGNSSYAVVADQVLAGTQTKPLNNGWIRVWEERGGSLELPFPNVYVNVKEKPDKRIHIRTYNYIGETPAYQATYVDCRFVGFTDGENFLL